MCNSGLQAVSFEKIIRWWCSYLGQGLLQPYALLILCYVSDGIFPPGLLLSTLWYQGVWTSLTQLPEPQPLPPPPTLPHHDPPWGSLSNWKFTGYLYTSAAHTYISIRLMPRPHTDVLVAPP